jgi:hypothetical protein
MAIDIRTSIREKPVWLRLLAVLASVSGLIPSEIIFTIFHPGAAFLAFLNSFYDSFVFSSRFSSPH